MPIRNLAQTAQERTIIKTAPDVIVYLEGLPYLLNPYIKSANGLDYTLVSFNDHVLNFSATYDTDNLMPAATISLSVPNHLRHLYQAPGGNNIIESMMEVQVFSKGYYLSPRGNTVYYRTYKGVTSHISHTDDGTQLAISIQCQGQLYFLEKMQIDLSPALMSNSSTMATAFQSIEYGLTPYEIIAHQFQVGLDFTGFRTDSILQSLIGQSDFGKAVKAGYVAKWQQILTSLAKDVHVFGYTFNSRLSPDSTTTAQAIKEAQGKEDPKLRAKKNDVQSNKSPRDPKNDYFVDVLRRFLPDMSIGSIQLLGGRIISRLERVRQVIQMIGFEGFQDVNGEIIIKPPLYNLDVTNLGAPQQSNVYAQNIPSRKESDDLWEGNNPFIVQLDEMESEGETEDEKGIIATRMTVQPDFNSDQHMMTNGTEQLRPAIWHIDIPKLAKFGIREQPAHTLGWLNSDDKIAAYNYAVSEMVRANRGYRQYTFTIPLRPELRLGFPMYIPHKDMYGYIKTISLNYSQGGKATMTVVLDTLRKRPMFPTTHKTNNTAIDAGTGAPQEQIIYTTQPNLVMKWTKAPPASASKNTFTATQLGANPPVRTKLNGSPIAGSESSDPKVNLVGNPGTLTTPQSTPIFDDETKVIQNRRNQLGTAWGTRTDTKANSFRVQKDAVKDKDIANAAKSGVKLVGGVGSPFFSAENWTQSGPAVDQNGNPIFIADANGNPTPETQQTSGINMVYLKKILDTQPFTDEKGYELATPFPWGRWMDLRTCIRLTREGRVVSTPNPQEQEILTNINTFLFAGVPMATPNLEAAGALKVALQQLNNSVREDDSFELVYPGTDQSGGDSSVLSTAQPENVPGSDKFLVVQAETDLQNRVDLFLSGTPQPDPATQRQLTSFRELQTTTSIGVTPPDEPQEQSILDKIVKPDGGTI